MLFHLLWRAVSSALLATLSLKPEHKCCLLQSRVLVHMCFDPWLSSNYAWEERQKLTYWPANLSIVSAWTTQGVKHTVNVYVLCDLCVVCCCHDNGSVGFYIDKIATNMEVHEKVNNNNSESSQGVYLQHATHSCIKLKRVYRRTNET